MDALQHRPYGKYADRLTWGLDAAFVWGGLSATAAYSALTWDDEDSVVSPFFEDGFSYLVQVGYLFPGTAWEIAGRWSALTFNHPGGDDESASEYGFAVNYYIDGHADKVTLDVAFISGEENGHELADTYAAYLPTGDGDGMLVRLQWQLAL